MTSRAAVFVALGWLLAAPPAPAQAISTIATFNGANGASPYAGVTFDAAGNLYGTTLYGGASGDGTVYEIAKGSSTITTIAAFDGTNGANPYSGVTFDAAGNLYGTTYNGGSGGDGTVYEIAKGSDTITTLATFSGANGANPYSGVTFDAAGNLYGTTYLGGSSDSGTVFEIAKGSGTLTTLSSFSGYGGFGPAGTLTLDAAGNLYGTTAYGGPSGYGTVFEIAKGSTTPTTLATFDNSTGGAPFSGVTLDAAGNLYGTTYGAGSKLDGTVYEIAKGSSTITTLVTFNGTNGDQPQAGVAIDAAGNLYGTTRFGLMNYGTVYEIPEGSSSLTTLATFDGTNGNDPIGGVALDAAGNLYGTTYGGVPFGDGTVFELAGAAAVPEPSSLLLIGIGAAALAARLLRR